MSFTERAFSALDFARQPVPPRRWDVKDFIPSDVPVLFSGDGGTGKTTLQLGAAKAAQRQWLGLEVRPGRTLFLSAEDDSDELHRRLASIRVDLGVPWEELADVTLLPLVGDDAVLGIFDARKQSVVGTPMLAELEAMMLAKMTDLLVLDTLSDVFAGQENDRQQARQFVGLLRGLCKRADATILTLSHPSLSGMASGSGMSGSTGWHNAVRSRLYLSSDNEDELRTLSVKKNNYGPRNQSLELVWQNGVYKLATAAGRVARTPEDAEACFLEMLDRYAKQERHVSPSPSANYAPSIFASDASARRFSKDELKAAMNRLFEAGAIEVEHVGPPSRTTTRIARAKK